MSLIERLEAFNAKADQFNATVQRFAEDLPRIGPAMDRLFDGTPGEQADARVELFELCSRLDAAADQTKPIVALMREIVNQAGREPL